MGHVHGAEEVHLHHLADDRGVGVGEQAAVGNAGVVDQHVHPAPQGDRLVDGRSAVLGLGDVAHPGDQRGGAVRRGHGRPLFQGPEPGRIAVERQHARACLQESLDQRPPQATGGAGDDDTACFKAAHGQPACAPSAGERAWR